MYASFLSHLKYADQSLPLAEWEIVRALSCLECLWNAPRSVQCRLSVIKIKINRKQVW